MSRRRRWLLATGAGGIADRHRGPNMTPMVDIVMVILIFFMACSAILGPEWFLKTVLPSNKPQPATVDQNEQPTRVEVVLSVGSDGATIASSRALEIETLDAFLTRLEKLSIEKTPGSIEVLLKPDAAVPYQDIVRIHGECQRLGISKVGMTDRGPAIPAR